MSDRHPHVVNEADLPWHEYGHGERFAVRDRWLAEAAGGQKLGCSLYEVLPGKRAGPFHCHFANEEAIYVLAGAGTLRIGAAEVPLRAGDYVALPVGEATAHQIINTSGDVLRYLCLSTMIEPDVVKFPDSGKVMACVGPPDQRTLRLIVPESAAVDYWHGEGDAP